MSNAGDIASRFWNQPQKASEEEARERTFIDDIIQKDHIERLIRGHAGGIATAFDGGAGSGRFSIMLAQMGVRVVHFDISQPMIDAARARAIQSGVLDNMQFIHGRLEDLRAYRDRQFDMVLSIDSPISYTYPQHEAVIGNLVRLAGKKVIFSVASNMGWIPYLFNPAQKAQYILNKQDDDPFVRWTLDDALPALASFVPDMAAVRRTYARQMMADLTQMLQKHDEGQTQWPHTYAFMPDELRTIMAQSGARNIRLSGPGALSRCIPNEVLVNIMGNATMRREFLDFCFAYDTNPYCAGMGKDNLVACADV